MIQIVVMRTAHAARICNNDPPWRRWLKTGVVCKRRLLLLLLILRICHDHVVLCVLILLLLQRRHSTCCFHFAIRLMLLSKHWSWISMGELQPMIGAMPTS